MVISCVPSPPKKHINCIRWLMNNLDKKVSGTKRNQPRWIHVYIKILYNRAAYTLYFKAYIKYKNKDKQWRLPPHLEWNLFSFRLPGNSVCRQMAVQASILTYPESGMQQDHVQKLMSRTWNGHGVETLKSFHKTHHFACNKEKPWV